MTLIPGKVYELIPTKKTKEKDMRVEKKDRRYIYLFSTQQVAVFRHIKGGYKESWRLTDLQDKHIILKAWEE